MKCSRCGRDGKAKTTEDPDLPVRSWACSTDCCKSLLDEGGRTPIGWLRTESSKST